MTGVWVVEREGESNWVLAAAELATVQAPHAWEVAVAFSLSLNHECSQSRTCTYMYAHNDSSVGGGERGREQLGLGSCKAWGTHGPDAWEHAAALSLSLKHECMRTRTCT
jgi:hypothetical protein